MSDNGRILGGSRSGGYSRGRGARLVNVGNDRDSGRDAPRGRGLPHGRGYVSQASRGGYAPDRYSSQARSSRGNRGNRGDAGSSNADVSKEKEPIIYE